MAKGSEHAVGGKEKDEILGPMDFFVGTITVKHVKLELDCAKNANTNAQMKKYGLLKHF